MNIILLLVIGFLVFIGTYMILSLNLIRIVIGISIYTHAGNLIIMSMGKYSSHMTEPLIGTSNTNYVDPDCHCYWLCDDCFSTRLSIQNLSCNERSRN